MASWVGIIAVIGFCVAVFVRSRSKEDATDRSEPDGPGQHSGFTYSVTSSIHTTGDEDLPNNPRFATWEEAMNRPITDRLRFRIEYIDRDGVVSEREIEPIMIRLSPGRSEVQIDAKCYLRNDERTFRSERIQKAMNLKSNREIRDLGQYLRAKY